MGLYEVCHLYAVARSMGSIDRHPLAGCVRGIRGQVGVAVDSGWGSASALVRTNVCTHRTGQRVGCRPGILVVAGLDDLMRKT